nr:hypothetical protein [Tanacetum cinerariifolium]
MQGEETIKGLTVAEAFLEDVECTIPYAEPLAITTTTTFYVSHEDAYDSDVDEAPHAAAAFMANLMRTGLSTGHDTSNDTDFHSEVYWLPANEVASYNCNQSKPVTNFVRTRPAKSQVNTQLKMLKACFPEFDKVFK